MRIAVTGATGNVGTALLRRLDQEPNIQVVGIARRPPPSAAGKPYAAVEWHEADLGDAERVHDIAQWLAHADAVVHLAWQIQPSHRRGRLRRTNVQGTRHLLQAMRRADVTKLVYASSVGAYAPGPKDRYVDESWPVTGVPRSTYSIDKATVEAILDNAENDNPALRVTRLRKALVFQRDAGAEITRYFLGPLAPVSLLRRGRLPAVPSNERLRAQVVHADDAAEAYLCALRADVTGAFNIATEPVLDGKLLAEELHGRPVPMPLPAMRALAGAAWRARLQPTEPGWLDLAAAAPLMDTARAREQLGWQPRRDGRETLHELLDGIAAQAGTASPAMRQSPGSARRLLESFPDRRRSA